MWYSTVHGWSILALALALVRGGAYKPLRKALIVRLASPWVLRSKVGVGLASRTIIN
jgi:hypothetical protein